ncbi:hypothetical protein BH24ACT14_BH24ACT14_08780 [soil metagenome]
MAIAGIALLVTGCQPAGGPGAAPTQADPVVATTEPLGAPDDVAARTLPDLLSQAQRVAKQWQDQPRLAEIDIALDGQGGWTGVRMLYLAAEADRFLALRADGNGLAQQQPTLSTLRAHPISAAGLTEVPRLPAGVREPAELVSAAAEALDSCGVAGPVTAALYATGAPVAWDGDAWTVAPLWSATLSDAQGRSVVVDPSSGRTGADPCL